MGLRYSFDIGEFDFAAIHAWLTTTYWSPGIALERVRQGFQKSSLVVGCFDGSRQVGAARCLTDSTRFAYVADVYVDSDWRGKGIASDMVARLLEHPDVAGVDACYLLTKDAHKVYERLGFRVMPHPDRVMVRYRSGVTDPCGPQR